MTKYPDFIFAASRFVTTHDFENDLLKEAYYEIYEQGLAKSAFSRFIKIEHNSAGVYALSTPYRKRCTLYRRKKPQGCRCLILHG